MGNYVIATIKSWNIQSAEKLKENYPNDTFYIIDQKGGLTPEFLQKVQPDYIFFPHWSWYIPESVYLNHRCVVFHMADLPFGRGGSPLQNHLVRGIYQTKISAIAVSGELDAGDIYLQIPIDISTGNADEIFQKASDIIFGQMIPRFLDPEKEPLKPVPQKGPPTIFPRRTPEQSCIPPGRRRRQLYDYIRMLDGEGYPPAYIQTEQGKIYFRNAQLEGEKLTATVSFEVKQ